MIQQINTVAHQVNEDFQKLAHQVNEEFETGRQRVVEYAYQKLPEPCAYIVDKVSKAVPDVFAALAAVIGGIVVFPALIINWGRKIPPAMPLIMSVFRGNFEGDKLADGIDKTWQNFKKMFDETLVPAFFVAMLVDTIFSYVVGYLCFDLGRALYATTIGLPGVCLAVVYMLQQQRPYTRAADVASPITNS
jgi:hypothetical protein